MNESKAEVWKKKLPVEQTLLFHGSRGGFQKITPSGSSPFSDFGSGFYLTENYFSASRFVALSPNGSVYGFRGAFSGLSPLVFDFDENWLLTIALFHGLLREYSGSPKLKELRSRVENADLIYGPLVDNMTIQLIHKFAEGEISSSQALGALQIHSQEKEWVVRTSASLALLHPIEPLFVSSEEKKDLLSPLFTRKDSFEKSLEDSKRKHRNDGYYVDEIL